MRHLIRWLTWVGLRTRVEATTHGPGLGAGREFAARARARRVTHLSRLVHPGDGWTGHPPRRWIRPIERWPR